MKKIFIIALLMFSVFCIAQDTKGTIKVKRIPISVQRVDTVSSFDTTINYSYILWNIPQIRSSYGKNYDSPPQFIGANDADRTAQNPEKKFVDGTRIYPDCYKCKGTTVFTELTMMVKADGSLTDIVVKKGAKDCLKCDDEAIRIVKLMPNWKPAQLNGQNIDLKWDTSITFTYLK